MKKKKYYSQVVSGNVLYVRLFEIQNDSEQEMEECVKEYAASNGFTDTKAHVMRNQGVCCMSPPIQRTSLLNNSYRPAYVPHSHRQPPTPPPAFYMIPRQ